ncbi:MAG: hypothetical protein ACI8W8_004707, partial [Rhodothermales bacterium]
RPEEAAQEDPKKTPAGPARPKKSQVQVAKKCQDQTAAATCRSSGNVMAIRVFMVLL